MLPYVLNIWPRFKPDQSSEDEYENYCYARMILHHPFWEENELLGQFDTWKQAYENLCLNVEGHSHKDPLPLPNDNDDADAEDSDSESIPGEEEEGEGDWRAQWMLEAARHPNQGEEPMDIVLGTHDIDIQYNWLGNSPAVQIVDAATTWLTDHVKESPNDDLQMLPDVDYSLLKGEQCMVFLQVMAYFKRLRTNPEAVGEPLRINIDGMAGTGKSFLIWAITKAMRELYNDGVYANKDPVVCLAPTGIAAFGIRGWTINYGLSIPVREARDFRQLEKSRLQRHQTRWKDVKLIIVDEKSMIGRTQLGKCDRRLRQAFPTQLENILANMPALVFGDFGQLPPIGDTPMYSTRDSAKNYALTQEGRHVYESFSQSITLGQIFRQEGENQEQVRFRDTLANLRSYSITNDNYNLLASCFWDVLTPQNHQHFTQQIHLLPTRVSVQEMNFYQLSILNKPVVRCKAKHNCSAAKKASEEDADGLEKEIFLAEEAHVMLTRNIWTAKGRCKFHQHCVNL